MILKRRTLAAFAAPCLPLAAVGLPLVVYLPPYYAGTLGLDLAVTGFIFFIVRALDVPLDPVIGNLIDRTRGRFGRFRPWMAAGGLVMMLGVAAAFFAAPGLTPARALAGLLLMYVGYSAAMVSHTTWGSAMSPDYHERSRIFGWWQAANMLGLLGILAVPPLAQWLAGSEDKALGVHVMGWVIIALLPLTIAWNLWAVPERPPQGEHPHGFADIIAVAKLPLVRRLLLVDLVASIAPGIGGALLLFFFEAARGYPAGASRLLLLFYFAAALVAAPFWAWLARRTSKHRATATALISYAVLHLGLTVLPAGNFALAALGMALAGVPAVAPPFLLRAMMADVSDAETLRTGRERAGLCYAALVAVQKLGYAIPVGVSYMLLDLVGFDAKLGPANSPGALQGLILLFVVPPVICAVAAALMVRRWPLDADAQARNAAALAAS